METTKVATNRPSAVNGAFQRALGRFRTSLLAKDDVMLFKQITTEADIRTLIHNIEVELGMRGGIRNMRRIEPFLNLLSQYRGIIEAFVGVYNYTSICYLSE